MTVVGYLIVALLSLQGPQPGPATPVTPAADRDGDAIVGTSGNKVTDAESGSIFDRQLLDRLKKELDRPSALKLDVPAAPGAKPTFRIETWQYRFNEPSFSESFKIPKAGPQPFGGSDYYNMMRLITPPEFWGSAPFTNSDLLKMWGLTAAYALAGKAVKKGLEAERDARYETAREEVAREMAEVAEHNAKVAQRAAADNAGKNGKKEAEKKKQKGDSRQ